MSFNDIGSKMVVAIGGFIIAGIQMRVDADLHSDNEDGEK